MLALRPAWHTSSYRARVLGPNRGADYTPDAVIVEAPGLTAVGCRRSGEARRGPAPPYGMRASSAFPSASRTGSSSMRSSTSWKNPRTISRSASERGRPRAIA
jgi:hypothetical protein